MSPARIKANLFTAVLFRFSQLTTAKQELPALSTTRYLFLATAFHSRPRPGIAVSMRLACNRRQYVFLPALRCGKMIPPLSVNFMQNPQMTDTTKPKTQGKEGNTRLLMDTNLVINFYIHFYTKKDAAEAFSSASATPQRLSVPCPSAEGLQPQLRPAQGLWYPKARPLLQR